ncbi:tetratricopeptide repeat protein [Lyngbya confervoides]|uniref:Tetratricopeptide repeat protein n=1 Tax=Lyngbya confervoides BDU141951 TaxID=1574623 RepID=A0ABD4T0H3_9CYAN|nr:tetratricopeptide repeat protein [Lyngbya confervoides]MCM1981792.1 tetratricopeptide repeat protein [Lyngbya confervoides BDU141951]
MINLDSVGLNGSVLVRVVRLGLGVCLLVSSGLLVETPGVFAQSRVQMSQLPALDYLIRAEQRLTQGDYQGAIADLNRVIQIDSMFAPAYIFRGAAKVNLRDYPSAIADFNQAIQLDPTLALAYVGRGEAKANLGDYPSAIADFNQAIQLDPTLALAYVGRGVTKANLGDYPGAIAELNQAIQLDPTLATAYANRSEGYTLLKKGSEALQDAEQAIRLDPKLHYGYVARGAARIETGDFAGAQADFDHALRLAPKEGFAYYWRGLLALKQGQYQQAIADYDQALRLTPAVAGYENYSLTARRLWEGKTATQPSAPPPRTSDPTSVSPTPPDPRLSSSDSANVYQIAGSTTVLISGQHPGSGVIVSRIENTYYLLTARHVVETPDEYRIITENGNSYPVDYARVIKLIGSDLAVIPFSSNKTLPIAQLGNSKGVSQGDAIFISGWPAVDEAITQPSHLVTRGEIVGVRSGNRDGYELLYDNSTGPGMSGGPIFNRQGQIIGIHGRAAGNPFSGKVGINLGIPIHLFLQQAPQVGLNIQQLRLQPN